MRFNLKCRERQDKQSHLSNGCALKNKLRNRKPTRRAASATRNSYVLRKRTVPSENVLMRRQCFFFRKMSNQQIQCLIHFKIVCSAGVTHKTESIWSWNQPERTFQAASQNCGTAASQKKHYTNVASKNSKRERAVITAQCKNKQRTCNHIENESMHFFGLTHKMWIRSMEKHCRWCSCSFNAVLKMGRKYFQAKNEENK